MSTEPDPKAVLVVDDDERMRQTIRWALEDEGYVVATAGGAEDAVAAATERRPAVVVLDYGLAGGDGAEVARRLRAAMASGELPIVLITADGRASEKAARVGAAAYLHKPFDLDELVALVARSGAG
jgi:two-component system phosphate regulon response regulator PhoB